MGAIWQQRTGYALIWRKANENGRPRAAISTGCIVDQSSALKFSAAPSLIPENQRAVTVLVLV
jgi:hypothetical protein